MADIQPRVGHDLNLFYNDTGGGGTYATPTWVEIACVRDVNIPDQSINMAPLQCRASDWIKNLAALIDTLTLEFDYIHGAGLTVMRELIRRFYAREAGDYLIINGLFVPASGDTSEGLRLPAFIENFSWTQNQQDVSVHEFRLVTAYYQDETATERDPVWDTYSTP